MEKEIAKAAMQFMMRAQLTGQEVPAFNAVMQELDGIVRGEVAGGEEAEHALRLLKEWRAKASDKGFTSVESALDAAPAAQG